MNVGTEKQMKVRVYGDGWREFGATRWEVEWVTVKPSAVGQADIDPDTDTIANVEYFQDKPAARKRAKHILKTVSLCWGCVTVTKQIVGWFVEEDCIAEWVNSDSEELA